MTTTLQDVAGLIAGEQRTVDRLAGEARHVASEGKACRTAVTELEQTVEACDEAILVLQSFGEKRQEDLQNKIETLVTYGLRTIFGDDMSFHITEKDHGKLRGMDFVIRSLVDGTVVETSIMDARGGGVASVAGFLLRLIVLLLQKNTVSPVLVLDETFAQLSEEYEPRLADFMRELVDKTGAQIILVTHSTAYNDVADIVHRFTLVDGVTHVTS